MPIIKTLKQVLKEELFKELVSLLTIGFTDNDIQPLNVDEQREFFLNDDVDKYMNKIVNEIEQWMFGENMKELPYGDVYRELIYEKDGLYVNIIRNIEEKRNLIDGDNYKYQDKDFLRYDDYQLHDNIDLITYKMNAITIN